MTKTKLAPKNKLSIPYFTLERQNAALFEEINEEMREIIESGSFILGSKVESFEKAFSQYCGTEHAVGCASGTDALTISFKALGIGPGDEVIVPSYTHSATVFGFLHHGARPVFVDIDESTFTIHPEAIRKAVTRKTKAILPVHLYG